MSESSWWVSSGFDLCRPGTVPTLRRLVDHVLFDLTDDEDDAEEDDHSAVRYTGTANGQPRDASTDQRVA